MDDPLDKTGQVHWYVQVVAAVAVAAATAFTLILLASQLRGTLQSSSAVVWLQARVVRAAATVGSVHLMASKQQSFSPCEAIYAA